MTSLQVQPNQLSLSAPADSPYLGTMLEGLEKTALQLKLEAAANPAAAAPRVRELRATLEVIRDIIRTSAPASKSVYRSLRRNCELLELRTANSPAKKTNETVQVKVFGLFGNSQSFDLLFFTAQWLPLKDLSSLKCVCKATARSQKLGERAIRGQLSAAHSLDLREIRECQGILKLDPNNFRDIFRHCGDNLRSLTIADDLTVFDLDSFGSSLDCIPNLTKLDLASQVANPPDKYKALLTAITDRCPLTAVDLTFHSWMTDDDLARLADKCPGMRTLALRSFHITDGGMARFAAKCTNLQNITLWGCRRLTDETARVLERNCHQLETFHCPPSISQRAQMSLAKSSPHLRVLSVRGPEITEEDFVELATSEHPGLVKASFANTKITLAILKAFIDLSPQLKEIDLSGCNNISLEAIKEVVRENPKLCIQTTVKKTWITGKTDTINVVVKSRKNEAPPKRGDVSYETIWAEEPPTKA